MNTIPIAAILIMLMSGMVAADQEVWEYGRANEALDGIEYVIYNFEEGMNLYPFKNVHPGVASFETVDVPGCYGDNEPSYVVKCANCGPISRCIMHIYPYNTRYTNGTPLPYIHIVNGDAAFSPRVMGTMGYWPGCRAFISFKEDTNYISFLASTNYNLYVRAYDPKGNYLAASTIYYTTDRIGDGPSNFTRFTLYLPGDEIGHMTFSGPFNGWHIDDLIVGGEPGYLNKPVDYTYVARRAQELHGVDYLEHGLGADYEVFEYLDPWQFTDSALEEYWNPETKQFELGEGISNAGLILWAYNYDSMELMDEHIVKRSTVAGMEKHDFKVDVDSSDIIPGDVGFKDRDYDGYADEVYMVIEPTDTGMDLITSCPDESIGVIYSKSSILEGSPTFMGYKRLPGVIRGGKNPIPKGH